MSPEVLHEYDAEGRLVRVDYIGDQEMSVTVFNFDASGDLIFVDEPAEQDAPAADAEKDD